MRRLKNHIPFLFALLFFGAFLSISAATAQETLKPTFGAQSTTLDNGLELIVIPNHRAPVIQHMIWYRVGAADEPEAKSGLAHFFEHLMFRGTKNLEDGEFSKKVAGLGGQDNAFTSQDYTAYFQAIATEHLGTVMSMEADRMINLDLNDEVLNTERKVIMEERRQRMENSPFNRFSEKLDTYLYPNHPYSDPIIGWMHEIENLSNDDIRRFYQRWYAPNNAIVVISGDIAFEEAKALAEKHYGSIPAKGDFPPRLRPVLPANLTQGLETELRFSDPQIRQVYWRRHMLAPSEAMDRKTAMALDLITEILAGSQAAPLYKELVQDKELAISASMNYSAMRKDWGPLSFHASFDDESQIEAFKQALQDLLARYAQNGFSADELARAKDKMLASSIYARDSLRTPAYLFGMARTLGLSIKDVEYWAHDIEKVTLDDINAVYQSLYDGSLSPISPIEAILTPPTTAEDDKDSQEKKTEEEKETL